MQQIHCAAHRSFLPFASTFSPIRCISIALITLGSCLFAYPVKAQMVTAKPSKEPASTVHHAPTQATLPAPPAMRYMPGMAEPLVAIGPVTEQENKELDTALAAFHNAPAKAGAAGDYDDYAGPLLAFIHAHPVSNWNASLYLNVGLGYYQAGYYSRTFGYFEKSWELGRNASSVQGKQMADRAMGELAEMHARLGHAEELDSFFKEVGDRPVSGPASFMMESAHEGLASFRYRPEVSYLCGPAALKNILLSLKAKPEQIKVADDARSGTHGFSLTQLAALADQAGLKYGLIYRKAGQPVPVPSIINWKVHHYAAIVEAHDGHYRLIDPTFGAAGSVVTEKAADEEGSGYYLVPANVLAANPKNGWRTVAASSQEAQSVYGMGNTFSSFPGGCNGCTPQSSAPNSPSPMTRANSSLAVASLHLSDSPVGYKAPIGIPATVIINYNAREGDQPGNFSFSNLSPLWAHNFQAYVQDDPNNPGSNVVRIIGGGGGYDYNVLAQLSQSIYNSTTGQFVPETYDNSQLVRVPATGPATSYVRNLPNGGKETYALSNGATVAPRIMFLTSVTDPAGNQTTLHYDSKFRLTTITDATTHSTTFTYGLTNYPLLITKITDPFGRYSSFVYDSNARLSSITDPIGITSSFTYGNNGEPDFVTALTTPYGTSKFSDMPDPNVPRTGYLELSLAMTDPLGAVQLVHVYQNQAVTGTGPEGAVPAGMENDNSFLMWRNTYFWNAHEAANGGVTTDAKGNPTSESFANADIYHWFHQCCTINYLSTQLGSHKRPLEKYREWYNTIPIQNTGYYSGTLDYPTFTGRVLDDGTTQLTSTQYNGFGLPLIKTDAVGRTTRFIYASNNIDVLTVQQLTAPSTYQTIAIFGSYNALHEPQTYTGADGQEWRYSYNAAGQLVTMTDPLGYVTTYNYDTQARLYTVENANHKIVLTLTYDSANRVQTRTDSEGYTLTYSYDNIDRVTKITYPDGTTDAYDYAFQSGANSGAPSLDMRKHTDRLGRVTTYGYDADERLTSVTEPIDHNTTRTTSYAYYEDGTLKSITDAKGNMTYWGIDLQSRPVSKTYAYGTAEAQTETYAYEVTNSRLHSITDAMHQVKTFSYTHDNRVIYVDYTNSVNFTPNIGTVWDAYFPRIASMTDGTGTTNYAYTPTGTAGGLKLASIAGPYQNDTIELTYDPLGRIAQRNIPGGNESFGYDPIGRIISHQGPLGGFTFDYLGQTNQMTSRKVTNGRVTVASAWEYENNKDDRRLRRIENSGASRSYEFSYRLSDEWGKNNSYDITAIKDIAGPWHPFENREHFYKYDLSDRLLAADVDRPRDDAFEYDLLDNTSVASHNRERVNATYNSLNEMTTRGANGYDYDGQGNTLSGDGVRTYKWNAENQLIEIDYVGSAAKSMFSYDGRGHRTVDTEVSSKGETTTTRNLWCGASICQTRNGSDIVLHRDLSEGEYNVTAGQKFVYMQDHLGSVRDVLNADTGLLVESRNYSPYGALTEREGSVHIDYGYAGLFSHPESGLNFATYRELDGISGRWLDKDPLRESGGTNLYDYALSNPISGEDPLGLCSSPSNQCGSPTSLVILGSESIGSQSIFYYQLEGPNGPLTGSGYSVEENISPAPTFNTNGVFLPVSNGVVADVVGPYIPFAWLPTLLHPLFPKKILPDTKFAPALQTFTVQCDGQNYSLTTVLEHDTTYSNGVITNTVTVVHP